MPYFIKKNDVFKPVQVLKLNRRSQIQQVVDPDLTYYLHPAPCSAAPAISRLFPF
jgi:hypothetical protein